MKNFKEFKLESDSLKNVNGGKKKYVGTSIDCDTGKTESVWNVYGIFGGYKGQIVESDQA